MKLSFRQYIVGPIAHGSIIVSEGATQNSDGTYRFRSTPGGVTQGVDGSVRASFVGKVRFTGHDGELDMRISSLRLRLTSTSGSLLADVASHNDETGQFESFSQVAIADLMLAGIRPTEGPDGSIWSNVPAVLTAAGVPVFGEFYVAGQPLDPVTFKLAGVSGSLRFGQATHTPTPTATATVPPIENSRAAGTPVARAHSGTGSAGFLRWGFKTSFRNYVVGPIAKGSVALSGGATQNDDGTFLFPASGSGSVSAAAFSGAVRFTGHDGQLDLTISNLRVRLTEATGTLTADLSSRAQGAPIVHRDLALANLNLTGLTPASSGGGLSWAEVPVTLTAAGAQAFGGYYEAGQELDALSWTLALDADCAPPRRPQSTDASARTERVLTWGVKRALLASITTPESPGTVTLRDGVARRADGAFDFPAGTGGDATSGPFNGTIRLTDHDARFDLTLSNLRVELTGSAGVLKADVLVRPRGTREMATYPNLELASLNLSGARPLRTEGTVSWVNVSASLTAAGKAAFADLYSAGEPLDPISFTLGQDNRCEQMAAASAPPRGLVWKVSDLVWTAPVLAAAQEVVAPAGRDAQHGFLFPVRASVYDPTTGVAAADFEGSIVLGSSGRDGFRIRITDPSIVVDEAGQGRLLASVTHCLGGACGSSWVGPYRVTVARFTAERGSVVDLGNSVSWTVSPSYTSGGDGANVTFGRFPQSFLNSLDPKLRSYFQDTVANDGRPSPSNASKRPSPLSLSFEYTAPVPVGHVLRWGIKESFRAYVTGRIANGATAVSDGAEQGRDGVFVFPVAESSATSASFRGAVRFTGHDGELDMTVRNLRLDLTGPRGTLLVDVVARPEEGAELVTQTNLPIATIELDRVSPVRSDQGLTWSQVPTVLTEAGSVAFGAATAQARCWTRCRSAFRLAWVAKRGGACRPPKTQARPADSRPNTRWRQRTMASVQEQQEPTVRFSEAIRTASWALHGSAEGSSFMQDLLERRVDRSRYAQLVGQLYAVYSLLEEAGQAMRDHPAAAPFVREELNRMAALEADLRFFFGQDWPPQIQPNEGTQAYCDRLREVCFSWPGGFVAHHYTRYMGDLSGGQMIAKAVERSYDLQERRGTQFYVFDRIGDLSAFKNQYRANLDAGPWDDAEKQRIVEEVLLAYRLNARLLAAL